MFTACNHKQQSGNIFIEQKDSILVTYFHGAVNTTVAIKCEDLAILQAQHRRNHEFHPDLDTFIVDSAVVHKIIKLLDYRKPAADFSGDARMYATIKQKNGKIDHLCFDNFPNRVKFNGESCSMDKELRFLLRYYSGYYSWFEKFYLDDFEELKNPVYYQKVLEQIKLRKK